MTVRVRWRQHTTHIDGVRVRLRWREDGRAWRIKITDPAGDYPTEQRVGALVVASLTRTYVEAGWGMNVGAPRIIRDHEASA